MIWSSSLYITLFLSFSFNLVACTFSPKTKAMRGQQELLSEGAAYYIFIIPFDSTRGRMAVENPENWVFYTQQGEEEILPESGDYRAYKLLVDKRDTEISGIPPEIKLKQGFAINAVQNRDQTHWIVNDCYSPGNYLAFHFNAPK